MSNASLGSRKLSLRNAILFAAVAALCVSFVDGDLMAENKHEWGKVTTDELSYTLPDAYADEAAVALFDLGQLEIPQPYADNQIHFKHHRRCKIFNVAGAEDVLTVNIYVRSGEKIRDLKAQTISPEGKRKTEVSGKDMHKQTTEDFDQITFAFPAVEPGCFVEYRYEIRHERYLYLDSWYFQGELFTKESRFSVIPHKGFEYSVATRNVPYELQEPQMTFLYVWQEKCPEYFWQLENLAPVKAEPHMPPVRDYYASLNFQLMSFQNEYQIVKFAEHWQSLGEEYEDFLDHHAKNRGDIRDTTKSVLARFAGGSGLDTLKLLHSYVRDNYKTEDPSDLYIIDYTDTDDLLEKKKGTVAAKNLLLLEMLRSAGIEAKPLMIGTRDYSTFDPKVFHMSRFNYLLCLASVEGASYFLDTQDKYAAFGSLPPECMAEAGLLVDGEDSQPVQLTHPTRVSNLTTQARLIINGDGSAICSTHVCLQGHFLSMMQDLIDEEIDEDVLKRTLIDNSDGLKLTVDTASLAQFSEDDSVVIDLVIGLPDYCEEIEENLIFEPLFLAPRANPFEKSARKYPVDFRFERSYYTVTDVVLNDSLTVATIPEQIRESIHGIQFNRTTFGGGNEVRIISQLIVSKKLFDASEYASLRSTYEKVAQAGLERAAAQPNRLPQVVE